MPRRVPSDGPAIVREWRPVPTDRISVIVVCADAHRATVYRWRSGTLDRVETVRVYHQVKHPLRVATLLQQDRVSIRPANSREAASLSAASGRITMLAEILRRIRDLGGDDAWIVLCGIRRVVAPLLQQLETAAPARVVALDWPDAPATDTDVIEAALAGAAVLRNTAHRQRITAVAELADAGGRATG